MKAVYSQILSTHVSTFVNGYTYNSKEPLSYPSLRESTVITSEKNFINKYIFLPLFARIGAFVSKNFKKILNWTQNDLTSFILNTKVSNLICLNCSNKFSLFKRVNWANTRKSKSTNKSKPEDKSKLENKSKPEKKIEHIEKMF